MFSLKQLDWKYGAKCEMVPVEKVNSVDFSGAAKLVCIHGEKRVREKRICRPFRILPYRLMCICFPRLTVIQRIEKEKLRLTAQPFMVRLDFTSEDAEYDLSLRRDNIVGGLDELYSWK